MKKHLAGVAAAVALAGCVSEVPVEVRIARADPAASVSARGETAPVGTANDDAADDPAIWRNPADPGASLIVGTDKKAGLYVYGLDGRTRSFLDAGRVNNVDLRAGVRWGGREIILVAASNRNDPLNAVIDLYELDPASATLKPLAKVPAGRGEAYGLCLYRTADALQAFMILKDGTIRQIGFVEHGLAMILRTFKLATQAEGCAVDEARGRLYVGEEDRGLWRFDANGKQTSGTLIAPADGKRLVADVEGVTVAGDLLVVSSQGDNAYAVWRLSDESYLGRFRIAAGRLGATEETDGIDLAVGDFGSDFPGGLFVAQDGMNAPAAQNFKLVAWADVLAALNKDPR